jgi:hypothetical protein
MAVSIDNTPVHDSDAFDGVRCGMDDEEAITILIKRSVDIPEGRLRLATAEEFLIGELERHRFNTERAIEIYTFAVDNVVWASVKKMHVGKLLYRTNSQSGLGKQYAVALTEKFKAQFNPPIIDQRVPRRFLRFLLGA